MADEKMRRENEKERMLKMIGVEKVEKREWWRQHGEERMMKRDRCRENREEIV
jgi:hypothetical protein